MTTMPSLALYTGAVRHHRVRPTPHLFTRRLVMIWADTATLTAAHGWLLPGWRRRDFLRPQIHNLRTAALTTTAELLGIHAPGPVYVLAQPRHFGISYNPATFYIVCDDTEPVVLLVEVDNTPWRERFCYAAPFAERHATVLNKRGHVSPFNPMAMRYEWRFSRPEKHFAVRMKCLAHDDQTDLAVMMSLTRQPFSSRNLLLTALSHPCAAGLSAMMIYWQAMRLWSKGAPFYAHPRR